jgi:N-acyl-D-amino-acid deacylase
MDSHGGWISTAPDLVRFASAFDRSEQCKILKAASIKTMFTSPEGITVTPKDPDVSYGCGWSIRKTEDGKFHAWHTGSLDGTSTILVRRHDGLCWAVLFNTRTNAKGQVLSTLVDPLVHQAAAKVKRWPDRDLFEK